MTALSLVAAALVFSAVSPASQSVPAQGRADALVTLDKAAMVRLSATSQSGTACDVVDRVRGPFAHSGQAGSSNCRVDLLLDQGTYKLRLESSKRGKGQVRVEATEFAEQNPVPKRLTPSTLQNFTLKSGQQASFWLTVKSREAPLLRVSGRTVGQIALWRNGEWLEPGGIAHGQHSPEPGRPVHEWWLAQPLEAGDYLVRVYGTLEHSWPGGNENDDVEIELGFRDGPATRALPFTLGRSGIAAVRIPAQGWTALLSLDAPPGATVELQGDGIPRAGPTCRVEKKALVPQCAVWLSQQVGPHILLVRGPAGTKGLVEWAPRGGTGWYGGYYGTATSNFSFLSRGGLSVVGLHDLPLDTDAAPLGCMLVAGEQRLAWDFPVIGDGRSLDAQFNYDVSGALIWFDVKRSGRYRIETQGDRKSRCELYRFGAGNAKLERLIPSQPGDKCVLTVMLNEGSHQLSIFEGRAGIEHLVIKEDSRPDAKPLPLKAGCLLPAVVLGSGSHALLTNRTGAIAARGVTAEALPLTLDVPLHLTVDPGRHVSLPLARSMAALAQTSAGTTLAVGPDKLELDNPSDVPLQVTVFTPASLPPPPPLEAYAPKLEPLRVAKADAPVFFDFERGESHSMLFDVDKAGLYNVTTQGLLATRCVLRTPVVPDMARDVSGGRGRNCLVAGYLRPGRYMLTAITVDQSRGRASVLLTRRPARELTAVSTDGEAFFRAAAGDLVQQKLVVTKAGPHELATTAQGTGDALHCRLDDSDGWPLTEVPTSCSAPRTFAKGTYLWTQLPLTVESMRHTRLDKVVPPPVMTGNKPHPVDFFTWYQAHLGADGKDEFTFKLDGAADVDLVLTKGMQGRLFVLGADGKAQKAVDVVPPTESRDAPPMESPAEEGEGEGESAPEPQPDYASECEGEECAERVPERPAVQPIAMTDAPPPPQGHRVHLEAGAYKLVTEHARGDVEIDYQLHLGTAVLMPGMTRTLSTPARVPVSVPKDGTLRLRTRGEADVRCRLFDANGRLVLEGSDNGPDWNCSIAEPVTHGEYLLVLETETQSRSESTLSLSLAPVEDRGAATDGMKLALSTAVQSVAVPAGDALQVLTFKSAKAPFSCALEDGSGAVVLRQSRVTECAVTVRARAEKYRMRVWTTGGSAAVTLSYATKPAQAVSVASAGRWRTAPNALCLPASRSGPLQPCGPEASLEAGDFVFAEAVSLGELTLHQAIEQPVALSQRPWIEAVTAPGVVVLLEAHVQHGERAAPACAFGAGSVHDARAWDCYAASASGAKAIARLWAPVGDDAPIFAAARVRPVAVPAAKQRLVPGRQRLEWTGEAAAFELPAQPSRVALTLAPKAWAVQLDAQGKAIDLCAPAGDLTGCAFTGRGGLVLVSGERELRADATLELLDTAEKSVAFDGLYEASPRAPGQLKLDVPALGAARTLLVEGAARCVTTLSDGVRLSGCRAELPAGLGAELRVDHFAGPLRVLAFAKDRERQARLGFDPPALPPAPIAASTAVALQQGRGDRVIVIDRDAVVRVSSSAGVCGLFKGKELLAVDGLDAGCELTRVLGPGTYRAVVRPFAGGASAGSFRWSQEPIVALKDGIGAEEWLAPGESRLYRFATGSKGNVGFGVQSKDEALDCAIYDEGYRLLGEGCQQFLSLEKGAYLLNVKLPAKVAAPLRFKPVLLGLAGAKAEVPQAYLEDFFRRTGGTP